MIERDVRESKREIDKEIDSLDEEIKEAEASRDTAKKSRDYLKSYEGKALEEAKKEIETLDAAYKKFEAEAKAKSDDRAEKAKKKQALQDQIAQLAKARTQKIGAEVQSFEAMAKKDIRIGSLKMLETGKAPDRSVQRQYARASCYRADLDHFWEHVKDSAIALGGSDYAKRLFKSVPKTFTETLAHQDKVMRDFDYGDPDPLARAVQDFTTNARSLRAEIQSRMDGRGDGVDPTLQTQVDALVAAAVDGMMFSVATQLKTVASEGRLTECGAGHSVQRALDEVSERFTPAVRAERDSYQSEYAQQQHLLTAQRRKDPRLDRCWTKMTEETWNSLSKEMKKEVNTDVGSRLKTWSQTLNGRRIDAETLMADTSQVLVGLGQYHRGIQNARNGLAPGQGSVVERSLLKLQAVGGVFSSSMASEIEQGILAGRI